MSDLPEGGAVFTIRVRGAMDPAWESWFDGMSLLPLADGTTAITGLVRDQAELFGLLIRVRDLGLPLEGLHRGPVEHSEGGSPGAAPSEEGER